jgi:hypothetical protein
MFDPKGIAGPEAKPLLLCVNHQPAFVLCDGALCSAQHVQRVTSTKWPLSLSFLSLHGHTMDLMVQILPSSRSSVHSRALSGVTTLTPLLCFFIFCVRES